MFAIVPDAFPWLLSEESGSRRCRVVQHAAWWQERARSLHPVKLNNLSRHCVNTTETVLMPAGT